ncbi:MAG: ASKHA domain-containing protein [Syntrophorhabdaceae bacterium]|nr:ASKHA domain-containing protein [Syntrophorhabdaceae bacterium]
MEKFEIVFLPFGKKVKVNKEEYVLKVARRSNIPIESICGGKGKCGKCRIKILSRQGFSDVTEQEKKLFTEKELSDGIRLACLTRIEGNLKVEILKENTVGDFVRDKTEIKRQMDLHPAICQYYIEIPPPSLSDNESDIEKIKRILKERYNVSVSKVDPFCFKDRPSLLRKENWKINTVVWNDEEMLDIRPKEKKGLYGIAVDIGTTTIGAYLMSLKYGSCLSSGSILNPQIKFGQDIMTRIDFIAKNGMKGLMDLNKTLIKSLNNLIDRLSNKAGISKEDIFEATVVGNTVMHHIFLKINPSGLGVSPFTPYLSSSITLKAKDLGIKIHPAGNIYVLPVKGGFVGADCIGVVLALKPYLYFENYLIIDIGTNGEIVVGDRKRLVCVSCATGPALEGAHVKFGMRADRGAIERIYIDPKTRDVKYTVIGNTKPKGICGSGVIDAVSELFKWGIIDNSGRFKKDIYTERLRKTSGKTEFVIAHADETAIGRDITITQEDVRNIQFAKAAIYAGAKILLNYIGIERPKRVMLAGAFGNYIDIKNAYTIGMFPFSKISEIVPVGNAAGEGAVCALLNRKEREEAENITKKLEYIELTLRSEFQKEFLDALYIPHRKDTFPDMGELLGNF